MKLLPLLTLFLIFVSCTTTSNFSKRKYTKGRFKIDRGFQTQKGNDKSSKDDFQFQELDKDTAIHLSLKIQELPKSVSKPYVELGKKEMPTVVKKDESESKWSRIQTNLNPIPTDSTEVSIDDEGKSIALDNEQKAEIAFTLSIAGAIGLILFFLLGLALIIAAIVMANRVQRSVYNTVDGLRYAKNAKTIAWVSLLVFLALLIIGIGILILLLLV